MRLLQLLSKRLQLLPELLFLVKCFFLGQASASSAALEAPTALARGILLYLGPGHADMSHGSMLVSLLRLLLLNTSRPYL